MIKMSFLVYTIFICFVFQIKFLLSQNDFGDIMASMSEMMKEPNNNESEPGEKLESEESILMSKKEKKEYKESKFKCLNLDPKSKKDIKKFSQLSHVQKVNLFKKGPCSPIVLIPGYMATKLEFIMKDCNIFRKNHPNIMKSCGWNTCTHKLLKKFTVFINFEFDLSLLFGGAKEEKSKPYLPKIFKYVKVGDVQPLDLGYRKECLGNLLRLYFKKTNETTDIKHKYKIVNLQGAEIRPLYETQEVCGRSAVTNFLGDHMSTSRSFQGFHELINLFTHLGYTNGLNLFISPYDFRQSPENIIPLIDKAVKTAYTINKKKSILIGHSYGGILGYKYSLMEHYSLIKKVVAIGSPFLGAVKSFSPFLEPIKEFN